MQVGPNPRQNDCVAVNWSWRWGAKHFLLVIFCKLPPLLLSTPGPFFCMPEFVPGKLWYCKSFDDGFLNYFGWNGWQCVCFVVAVSSDVVLLFLLILTDLDRVY